MSSRDLQKFKKSIIFKKSLNENGIKKIRVQINDAPPRPVSINFSVNDKLSNIRAKLKIKIEMDDSLSFAMKKNDVLSEIGDESMKLDDILDDDILHLLKTS